MLDIFFLLTKYNVDNDNDNDLLTMTMPMIDNDNDLLTGPLSRPHIGHIAPINNIIMILSFTMTITINIHYY